MLSTEELTAEAWRIFYLQDDVSNLPDLVVQITPESPAGRAEKAMLAARTHLRLGRPQDARRDLTDAADAAEQSNNMAVAAAVGICMTEYLIQTDQADRARSCAATSLSMAMQAEPVAGNPNAAARLVILRGRAILLSALCATHAGLREDAWVLIMQATRLARSLPSDLMVSGTLFGPNALAADLTDLYLDGDQLTLAVRHARRVRRAELPPLRRRGFESSLTRLIDRLGHEVASPSPS
jgi:hypothetical protein